MRICISAPERSAVTSRRSWRRPATTSAPWRAARTSRPCARTASSCCTATRSSPAGCAPPSTRPSWARRSWSSSLSRRTPCRRSRAAAPRCCGPIPRCCSPRTAFPGGMRAACPPRARGRPIFPGSTGRSSRQGDPAGKHPRRDRLFRERPRRAGRGAQPHAGNNMLVVGESDDSRFGADKKTQKALEESGVSSPAAHDIRQVVWNKLHLSLGTGTLCLLAGCTVGDMRGDAQLSEIAKRVAAEGRAIAAAHGVDANKAPPRPAGGTPRARSAHQAFNSARLRGGTAMIEAQLASPLAFARAARRLVGIHAVRRGNRPPFAATRFAISDNCASPRMSPTVQPASRHKVPVAQAEVQLVPYHLADIVRRRRGHAAFLEGLSEFSYPLRIAIVGLARPRACCCPACGCAPRPARRGRSRNRRSRRGCFPRDRLGEKTARSSRERSGGRGRAADRPLAYHQGTPFWANSTAVSARSSGAQPRANAGRAFALRVTMTSSCAPSSAACSAARSRPAMTWSPCSSLKPFLRTPRGSRRAPRRRRRGRPPPASPRGDRRSLRRRKCRCAWEIPSIRMAAHNSQEEGSRARRNDCSIFDHNKACGARGRGPDRQDRPDQHLLRPARIERRADPEGDRSVHEAERVESCRKGSSSSSSSATTPASTRRPPSASRPSWWCARRCSSLPGWCGPRTRRRSRRSSPRPRCPSSS